MIEEDIDPGEEFEIGPDFDLFPTSLRQLQLAAATFHDLQDLLCGFLLSMKRSARSPNLNYIKVDEMLVEYQGATNENRNLEMTSLVTSMKLLSKCFKDININLQVVKYEEDFVI